MLPNVFACMNEWGGIYAKAFTQTTSYRDSTVVRLFNNLRCAANKFGHGPIRLAYCDNPNNDAKSIANLAFRGNGKVQFEFPGDIRLVETEDQCNEACEYLTTDGDGATLYYDTENVAYTVRPSLFVPSRFSLAHSSHRCAGW